ncbi:MAG: pantoate--beta-alanine ligase [Gammaproteobacteria bacterium]|jgi:pantoate--beta-alanine ligase|nr:pantoate--beta-alanine ligase [Gammaproteobacteria bacterium]
MQIQHTISGTREVIRHWLAEGESVALVPTMGNLHAGHMSLVEKARTLADRVVVSIFVNPLQFGPAEDFDAYPRTPDQDHALLEQAEVDLVFEPPVEEMYPDSMAIQTTVEVPGLSDELCGAYRARHFAGVVTVVTKLFNVIQPTVAVFGEKDYQQLLIIRRMTEDLNSPVQIASAPICREQDGLAMSSRNRYLDPEQRAQAPRLYATLLRVADMLREDEESLEEIESRGLEMLRADGFDPDYLAIRERHSLSEPGEADSDLVVLAAARLGRVRLIDNLTVDRI